MFYSLDCLIDNLKKVFNNVDSLVDRANLPIDEIKSRSRMISDLWSLLRIKYSQMF